MNISDAINDSVDDHDGMADSPSTVQSVSDPADNTSFT